jgi:hypothetical protein
VYNTLRETTFCVWRHVIFSVHSPTSGYCVLSHIPMVWRHVKVVRQRTSRAASRHSFITTLQHLLSNDKKFCFSLIGLNSIFSTLPQSEYTSRAVSIPRVQWVYLACSSEYTSRAVSIPRVQWVHLAWGIFGLVSIFVYCLSGVSTLSKQRRDFIFKKNCNLFCWIYCWKVWKIPYYLIKQLLTFNFSLLMTIRTWSMID